MKNQNSFPQRVGKLVENHIIISEKLFPNRRQQSKGYYDAYNSDGIYEIKAAKDNNYFRIKQDNHKLLVNADGSYIFVRYSLVHKDVELTLITDIKIESLDFVKANTLKSDSRIWLEDQRKKNLFYKVKI